MQRYKSLIRIRPLLAIVLTVVLFSSFLVIQTQAATPAEIEAAIDIGVEKLVDMQNADGSWHAGTWSDSHPIATTCLALVKLQERAYELGYESPFDAEYEYSGDVIEGWEFVLAPGKITKTSPLTVQTAGDPDVNANGYGLDCATPTVERYGYTQGICLMALSSTGTPSRPNDGGLDFDGDGDADTYLELAQDVGEHLAYGQVDSGARRGGWHYTLANNAALAADNSVTGYSVLGLAYAEDFGVNLPDFVKDETDIWVNYIQSGDGGSGYNAPGVSNLLRTGNLIFEMTFVDGGAAPATPRFQDALDYIELHWRDANKNPGWGYSLVPADYQAMYTLMKGLEYSGIDLIDTDGDGVRDNDWFNQDPSASPAQDFASVLVAQQNADGSWPGTCHTYGDPSLCQVWALLILEKAAPPPPIRIEVEKHYSYTNVCFERDNDGDGYFNEDPVDFEVIGDVLVPIDNDGDGVANEDDVDCPDGSYLGDPLPVDLGDPEDPDDDFYVLEAVVKKNGKVSSYNPGQYYAVSTVNVLSDVDLLTIVEDFHDCSGIGKLNPVKGGGRVVIVQIGGEIMGEPVPDPEAAYQIMDANSEEVLEGCGAASVTLEDVKAGTTILMYVKFGPALKGEQWDGPYGPCVNYNRAWVGEDRPDEPPSACANLRLIMKD
jgi:hypothetical protein